MKNFTFFCATVLLLTSFIAFQSRTRMFEVRVEAKINSCISRHDVIVEARNIQDAREKAQRVVQTRLATKAIRVKEIKQP